MAILKIYSDIQTERDKAVARLWGDAEGVSYADIDQFCASIPADDGAIDIRLHCDGGSVTEGWAMYDRLRATGKEITCTVEGNAASMATVILMAAPKERRRAYRNAHILIHNPWACVVTAADADDLQKMSNDLRAEQERLVNLYVERCGCTAEEIQSLMDADKFIDVDEASRLGIIGDIIEPISAHADKGTPSNQHNMNNNVEVKASLLDRMLAKLGFKTLDEASTLEIKGMELNTADGQTLTVEREEGAPQVGDPATPDGEWLMPDGTTVIVENGVIVEIRQAEPAPAADADDDKEGDDDTTSDDATADDEVQRLRDRIAELENENEELRRQLEESNANARTRDDLRILNAVMMAGGEEALARIQSTYTPDARQPQGKRAQQAAEDALSISADEIRNRFRDHRNKKTTKKGK